MVAVTDDMGQKNQTIHGEAVPLWLKQLNKVKHDLRTDPLSLGVESVREPSREHLCEDPDCARLHRMSRAAIAYYRIGEEGWPPVKTDKSENDKEVEIAQGHPTKPGTYLCQWCVWMGVTKRRLDVQREKAGAAT